MAEEEVVVQENYTKPALASESPMGGGISGRGFAKAAAKGILSGLNPLNTLKLLDGVARGEIEPKDAAKMLNPVGPITDAAKAIRQGRIDEGKDVVGRGRIKNTVKGFFSRDDGEDMAFGPGGKRVKNNKGSLVGNQSLLDKNNDGKISGEDFKMLREKKIFGGLLKLSSVGAKAAGKSLLADATKDIKKISKDLPSASQQKSIKDQLSNTEDGVGAAQAENKYHIQTLEDFFSGEPKLEKAIKQLRKQIYSKVKDKDIADDIYATKLLELESKYAKQYRRLTNDAAREVLERQEQMSDFEFMDPRYEEFGVSKEDLKPLTETQKRRNAEEMERIKKQGIPFNKGGRVEYQEGSLMVPPEMESEMPVDTYPNIPPEEMAEAEASQLPDAEMEDKYMDFVLDESLDDEEQSYLMNALEDDPKLSQIFDKVIMTASEFTGAGEVEGPGTGVSDSIPARLSDGEFVFTKKATDQIGADNLQMMMDDAERAFDGGMMREPKRMGGMMMEDEDPDLMEAMSNEDINRQMLMSNRAPSLLGTN